MKEKIVARIVVASESASSKEIEAVMGLVGDQTWEKGAARRGTLIKEKNSGWMIANVYPENTDVDHAVAEILKRLGDYKANLLRLGPEMLKEVSVVAYCGGAPAIHLSASTIEILAKYGLDFDLDLYGVERE